MVCLSNQFLVSVVALVFLFLGCSKPNQSAKDSMDKYANLELPEQPNILWIVAEDLSPIIPTYGDSTVLTPNISRLAREGVVYTNVFASVGVCSPSRAAIATGMYPTKIGAMHMRTGPWFRFTINDKAIENFPRKAYEAIPPEGVHMLSTYLRKAGYYCANNPKEDYQFRVELTAWDESGFEAHWKKRNPNQPFYGIFNLMETHESRIWTKSSDSLWVDEQLDIPIPPYLPTTEVAKRDVRRAYSNIKEMDARVGEILDELEESGELENTIIFWFTDHGGPLPRQKRTVYDSGLHVPMIVRFPDKQMAGQVDDQLLSFVDLKPTMLSLANIQPPDYVDGKAWLGKFRNIKEAEYIYSSADRFDNQTDRIRAVRDKRYKLIRNYIPQQSYYLPIKFREEMAIMQEMLRLRDIDSLTHEQALWFRPTKDSIELYDTQNDPYELNNLANNPNYKDIRNRLTKALDDWIEYTNDKGLIPEEEFIASLWPNGKQPTTSDPIIPIENEKIILSSPTKSAEIGCQWANSKEELATGWQVYTQPISTKKGKTLFIQAHRIGFRQSNIQQKSFN